MRNPGAKPWTLKEALARTASRAALIALHEARAASPIDLKAGEAIRADIFRLLAEASTLAKGRDASAAGAIMEQVCALEDRLEVEGEHWHELNDAQATIQKALQAAMAAGRAAGFGLIDGQADAKTPILPETWRSAYVDWEASAIIFGRGKGRTRLTSIEILPWLHLDDAAARLAGLSLATAFRRFVLDDPEFAAIVDRASWCSFRPCDPLPDDLGPYSCICNVVLDGALTADDPLWPASLAEYDLAVEWMSAKPRRFADLAPAGRRNRLNWLALEDDEARADFQIVREAERVVRDRFTRFMAPLRDGRIVVSGKPVGHGDPVISQAIWDRPTTRIDFKNGEVLHVPSDGPPEREWTGLMLSLVAPQEAAPTPPAGVARSKGGRKPKYLWVEALSRLRDKLDVEGDPDTGAELARMMFDCFEDMKGDVPSLEQIERWLRENRNPLWTRIVRG